MKHFIRRLLGLPAPLPTAAEIADRIEQWKAITGRDITHIVETYMGEEQP